MIWLKRGIIVIVFKDAISFTSFCSEYYGASRKTSDACVWVAKQDILVFPCTKRCCYCRAHCSYFLSSECSCLALFVPLWPSRCLFPPFEHFLCLCNFLCHCNFFLSALWGRIICLFYAFARSYFFHQFIQSAVWLFSFLFLFSSAVKRSVDFKSRGVKLFPGKDSSNKFSICEFTS